MDLLIVFGGCDLVSNLVILICEVPEVPVPVGYWFLQRGFILVTKVPGSMRSLRSLGGH